MLKEEPARLIGLLSNLLLIIPLESVYESGFNEKIISIQIDLSLNSEVQDLRNSKKNWIELEEKIDFKIIACEGKTDNQETSDIVILGENYGENNRL